MPVALPRIQLDLNATNTQVQWCVNAYLLVIAVFVLISGKLGDRIGYKRTLMVGVVGFVIFSALCGLSESAEMLIIARACQGLCAASIYPAQTAMIAQIYPPEKRGRATGMIVSIGSLFLILGPLVGGYLIEVASWRWIFWINLPIGAIGLWMINRFMPTPEKGRGKVDLKGFAYFALGVSALTLVFMQATDWGWTSLLTIFFAITAIVGLLLLLYREKRAAHPFLDISLFKHSPFAAININVFILQFFLMIVVFRTIYFQTVLGYSPFLTGFIMFISSCPVLFIAPLAGILSDRLSPKVPIALGYLLLIFSSFWFAFISLPSFHSILIALIAYGTGIPLIFTPSYSTAISSVPKGKAGTASGIVATLRNTGGTVGLALIHLFVSTDQKWHLTEGKREAEIISFSDVHFALAFLLIVAMAITFMLHSRKSSHHLPEGPAEGWD